MGSPQGSLPGPSRQRGPPNSAIRIVVRIFIVCVFLFAVRKLVQSVNFTLASSVPIPFKLFRVPKQSRELMCNNFLCKI